MRNQAYSLIELQEWCENNKPEFEILDTKTEVKEYSSGNSRSMRFVLIKDKQSNIEKWVSWNSFKKAKVFKIEKSSNKNYSEEYIQKELIKKFKGDIIFDDVFTNIKNKHKFICKIHGGFYSLVDLVLKGKYGCRKCYIDKRDNGNLTNQEFIDRCKRLPHFYNYEILEEYKGKNTTKIKFKHLDCGFEFYMQPNNFMNGQQCPKCQSENKNKSQRTNPEKFKNLIEENYPNKYKLLTQYVNMNTKIKVLHHECGHITEMRPGEIKRGSGCFICAKNIIGFKKRLSQEDVKLNLFKKFGDEFEVKSEYITNDSPLKVKHNICNEIFETNYRTLIQNGACPICKMTRPELDVFIFLKENNIKFTFQKTFDKCRGRQKTLPFDFYLEDFNLCIEVDGEFHYKIIKKDRDLVERRYLDTLKNKFCFFNEIKLVRIPFWEFNKIKEILKIILSL